MESNRALYSSSVWLTLQKERLKPKVGSFDIEIWLKKLTRRVQLWLLPTPGSSRKKQRYKRTFLDSENEPPEPKHLKLGEYVEE